MLPRIDWIELLGVSCIRWLGSVFTVDEKYEEVECGYQEKPHEWALTGVE